MKALQLVIALTAFTLASAARADFAISALGTVNFESPKIENSLGQKVDSSSSMGLGIGGLVSVSLNDSVDLEAGALLINRRFDIGAANYRFRRLQIPAVLKITALPIVSFGGGVYTEWGTEDDYAALNYSSTDFGLIASVSADVPLLPLFALVFDLRYNLGLKNLDNTPNQSFHFGGIQFLTGVKFRL